jgi:hypothetical protein
MSFRGTNSLTVSRSLHYVNIKHMRKYPEVVIG